MDAATADTLVGIAEEARARLRRQDPAAAVPVEERYPEMLQALDWYLDGGQPDVAFRLASALVPFWIFSKRIDDGDQWFNRALSRGTGNDAAWARGLHDHGYLVFWAGRYELAEQRFAKSLALAEELADSSVQALALAGLARVALNTNVSEAVRLLRRAVTLTEGLDDSEPGRSSALHVLGVALQMSGDLEGAREVMSARLQMGQRTDDEFVVFTESANLSMVERQLGNLDRAEELSRQALAKDAGRGEEMSLAWSLNGLAAVTAAKGDLGRAARLNGLAAAMLDRAGGEWPPDERQQYDETLSMITAGLPPDVLKRSLAQGAAMSLPDGVAFALKSEFGTDSGRYR